MRGSSVTATNGDSLRRGIPLSMGKKGRGHIYQRGKIWWVKYHKDGVPRYRSSKSTSYDDAVDMLNGLLVQPHSSPRQQRIYVRELLADCLDYYKTERQRSYKRYALPTYNRLLPVFGPYRAERITTELLKEYQRKLIAKERSTATVNRHMAFLRRAFNLARKCTPPKVQAAPFFPVLEEPPPREGFLEEQDYRRLCKALPPEVKPLLVFSYHYGNRRSELLRMQWSQVDEDGGVIRLWTGTTKNKKGRVLPIYGDIRAELKALRKMANGSPFVFTRSGVAIRCFKKSWATSCAAAGVPDLQFHDLRRSAVRNMIRAGIPERVAMEISGHKTRAIFDRYNIVDERDLHSAGRKMIAFRRAKGRSSR